MKSLSNAFCFLTPHKVRKGGCGDQHPGSGELDVEIPDVLDDDMDFEVMNEGRPEESVAGAGSRQEEAQSRTAGMPLRQAAQEARGITEHQSDMEAVGRGVFFLLMTMALTAFGLPLLVISRLQTPASLQTLIILGISHHRLVSVFLLSAALAAYVLVFFLKPKPGVVLALFTLSVFSCFPLVVGLKSNLSLQQSLLELPFFQNWPYFLRPGYILLEFLIPGAILICLALQLKDLFRPKPYRFTFLAAGVYLGIAAFFGLTALAQTGQPTLLSALARMKDVGVKSHEPMKATAPFSPKHGDASEPGMAPAASSFFGPSVNGGPAREWVASGDLEGKVQALSEKMDRILEILGQNGTSEGAQKAVGMQHGEGTVKDPSNALRMSSLSGTSPTGERPADQEPISRSQSSSSQEELHSRIQVVQDKVEKILDTLSYLQAARPSGTQAPATVPQSKPPGPHPFQAGQEEETASVVPPSPGPAPVQLEGRELPPATLDDLNRRIQFLSDKMDQVVEALRRVQAVVGSER